MINPNRYGAALSALIFTWPGLSQAATQSLTQESAGGATQAGDAFGEVLAVGNFNGDPFQDLVIGAPGEDAGAGAVFVLSGSGTGLGSGFWIKQSSVGGLNGAGDHLGAALTVGDFNNDGFDDLVIGAPGKDSGAGVIYYWRGSNTGLTVASGVVFQAGNFGCGAKQAGDEFGAALAAGDFNADGFDDLAIGAPGENLGEGRVCVVKGRTITGLAAGGGFYYAQNAPGPGGIEPGDRFGAALAAGRFSSGNHDDLAIGAPFEIYNGLQSGVVSVWFGAGGAATLASAFFTTGTLLTQALADAADQAGDRFGASLAAGDLTQDGRDEVIVGAPNEDAGAGAFFVFPSATSGPGLPPPNPQPRVYLQASTLDSALNESTDQFGWALATGDLDGNGEVDLVVGSPGEAPGNAPVNAGMIAEYFGASGGLDVGWVSFQGDLQPGAENEVNDRFGAAIALGDFDGDGRDELAMGAPGESPGALPAGGHVLVIDRSSTRLTHGPILGAVTANSVKVWARGNRATSFQVRYRIGAGANTVVNGPALAAGNDYSATITLGGLLPNTTYEYAVRLSGAELYVGTFRTLPVAGSPSVVRFAYGADISYWHTYRPHSIFGEVSGYAPQFLILGGDNIYADGGVPVDDSVTGYRHRYRETFNDPYLRGLLQDLPSFMMWDDHEIWNDYYPGGPGTGRYTEARQAFDEWQGSHNPTPATPGEIYYAFQAGGAAFFVLDTRSHRSNPTGAEGPAKSMLGAVQKQALFDWLTNANAPFKFIVSSVPFSDCASTLHDAWDSFTTERQEIYDFIASEEIPGVVFLAGDQHFSSIYRLAQAPYPLYEFMPSPLGISLRTPDPNPALQCDEGELGVQYVDSTSIGFGIFEVDSTQSPAHLVYLWVDGDGTLRHLFELYSDDLTP